MAGGLGRRLGNTHTHTRMPMHHNELQVAIVLEHNVGRQNNTGIQTNTVVYTCPTEPMFCYSLEAQIWTLICYHRYGLCTAAASGLLNSHLPIPS